MKNKKNNSSEFDYQNAMGMIMKMASQPGFGFGSFFGGMPFGEPEEKYPYDRLGDGYELRPIKLTKKEEENKHNESSGYSHLYHNGLKVSDKIFRRGGLGGDFKDGYCSLIHYTRERKKTKYGTTYFSSGIHVIVNKLGDICLSGTGISSYPSHCGGNLGKLKDTYYNLCTGEEVITCSSSSNIDGKRFMIVEHRYDWYNKSLPLGIYQIDKFTCECVKIDEAKK